MFSFKNKIGKNLLNLILKELESSLIFSVMIIA